MEGVSQLNHLHPAERLAERLPRRFARYTMLPLQHPVWVACIWEICGACKLSCEIMCWCCFLDLADIMPFVTIVMAAHWYCSTVDPHPHGTCAF